MNRQAFSLCIVLASVLGQHTVRAAETFVLSASDGNSAVSRKHVVASKRQQPDSCTLDLYKAGIGLNLDDATFSVAPTYRLPQSCMPNQIAQWKGREWGCGTIDDPMPAGMANQTLRYDAANAVVTNNLLQAFDDGALVAGGALGSGSIPATGAGTRMMWYPGKAAFRAGSVGAHWDDIYVGQNSVAMGSATTASSIGSVAMGEGTTANGPDSFATGYLTLATGSASTALGFNTKAIGDGSTALGSLTVAGGAYSTAMGRAVSTGGYNGSFIYGDSTSRTVAKNTANDQFVVVASGGVYFFTEKERTAGAGIPPGSSSWIVLSDRDAKTAVEPVDPREVLKKVVQLPMSTWQYKAQDAQYRHMGPMAQDFHAAFHLGESNKGIDTVDADGVALAAIQGLHAELAEKNNEIALLKARLAALELLTGDVAQMKNQLAALNHSASTLATVVSQP